MDFEIRCDNCRTVYRTEEDDDFDRALGIVVWFGNTIHCDKCGNPSLSAYAGNREQNSWHKIRKEGGEE